MENHRPRRAYTNISVGEVHYREAGEGAPVLLLHDNERSSAMWESVVSALGRAGMRAVAIDMPGHGASDSPRRQPSLRDYAGYAREVADALGLVTFDVIGHLLGSSVAMRMAVDYPDRVRRLVLWAVCLYPEDRMARIANQQPERLGEDAAGLVAYIKHWRTHRSGLPPGVVGDDEAIRAELIDVLQAWPRRHWAAMAVGSTDHAELAGQVSQPALLTNGESEATRKAAAIMRNGRYVRIPNLAHTLPDEAADALTAIIAPFLLG